jgi:hypothetical protein
VLSDFDASRAREYWYDSAAAIKTDGVLYVLSGASRRWYKTVAKHHAAAYGWFVYESHRRRQSIDARPADRAGGTKGLK